MSSYTAILMEEYRELLQVRAANERLEAELAEARQQSGDDRRASLEFVRERDQAREPRDTLRELLQELVRQVELSRAIDVHGHELKSLKALHDAQSALVFAPSEAEGKRWTIAS